MAIKYKNIETKLVKAGEMIPRIQGAVCMPVFQSATYEYTGESDYNDLRYIRLNNTPNHYVLHDKLAAVENGEAALVASSGMAAISTSLLTFLNMGDHLLVQDNLYGGTHDLITKNFPEYGISYDFFNPQEPAKWKSLLKPKTKAIYVETISNPLMKVGDLKAVVKFAKENRLMSFIDNTFASPVNFRPLEHGFDISLHSGTKYLNGHNDIVAGAAIGKSRHIEKIRVKLNHLGGTLDPHTCFLLERGMKTLALRVKYQNQSALKVARFFSDHPAISKVFYPGLRTSPSYSFAKELLDGPGGMMSIELKGGMKAAAKFLKGLKIPIYAPSLGGVETLITMPSTTSHAALSQEQRQKMGISESMIRLSIGIENTDDLLADFEQAMEKL